jgi:ribosomal protein S18 acetylase RimI-like enzyme
MRRVCVSARYRRRGLAQALVGHLQRAALALGLTKVIMSTPVLNAPAIAMYSRCVLFGGLCCCCDS